MLPTLLQIAEHCVRARKDILDAIHIAIQDNRHRRTHKEFATVKLDRRLNFRMNLLYLRKQVLPHFATLNIVQNDRENIGSDTRQNVVLAAGRLDALGNHAQHVVAKIDGIGRIYRPETVNIEERHAKGVARLLGGHVHVDLELFEEKLAVINARKRILVGVVVLFAGNGRRIACGYGTDNADGPVLGIHLQAPRNHNLFGLALHRRRKPEHLGKVLARLERLHELFPERDPVTLHHV